MTSETENTFVVRSKVRDLVTALHLRASNVDVAETWTMALSEEIEMLRRERADSGLSDEDERLRRVLEQSDSKSIVLLNKVRDVLAAERLRVARSPGAIRSLRRLLDRRIVAV